MSSVTLNISNKTTNIEQDIDVIINVHDLQKDISANVFDNFNNIKIDNIEYKSYIKNKDVKIAYFESQQLNSRNNLDILDFSWLLPNNNPNLLDDNTHYFIETTPSFSSNYQNILMTDKYTLDVNNNLLPLWFKHKSNRITKVTEFKKLKSYYEVNTSNTGYEIENGILYTNCQNTYDYQNDSYAVYIVTGSDDLGNVYNELLNTIPVFNEASWEDIYYNENDVNDPKNGSFKNDVYTVEEVKNRWNFNLFFVDGFTARTCNNGLNGFFWKPEVNRFLKIKEPNAVYAYDPWHLRIQNGSVYQSYNNAFNKYYIPEYIKQPFNPIFPCIKQNEKNCIKVTANIIKLPCAKIKYDPQQNINLDIILFDYNENAFAAYTTDVTKANTIYTTVNNIDIKYEYGAIKSIDESNAFVETNISNLSNADIIKCTYYESVVDFVYTNLDVNPANNKMIKDHKVVLYLKPKNINNDTTNSNWRAIEHLIVDKNDKIVEASNYNNLSNLEDLNSYQDFLNENFIQYQNDNQYLLLGEVFYKDDSKLSDCLSFDVRDKQRYFAVTEENYKANYKLQLSKYGFGISGMPIQLNNLLYLLVPESVYSLSEEDFNSKLYNNLGLEISNIRNVNTPDMNLNIYYSFLNDKIIRFDIVGTGLYELIKIDDSDAETSITSFTFNVLTNQEYQDYKYNIDNSVSKIKIVYTPDSASELSGNVYVNTISVLDWS